MKPPFVDFSEFSFDNVLVDVDGIEKINPHRFEMQLLTGILYQSDERAVGFKDLGEDEFWVRGHFPGYPLMPGVLICECAAQLSSYFAAVTDIVTDGYIGLAGLDHVRFRGPVTPGDRLLVMLRRGKIRRNVLFNADFQGYVDDRLVVEGVIKGTALPNDINLGGG